MRAAVCVSAVTELNLGALCGAIWIGAIVFGLLLMWDALRNAPYGPDDE